MRPLLLATALLLALAPAARGDAVGLRDAVDAEQIALAGPEVLVARNLPSGMELEAVPRAGGAPRPVLSLPAAQVAWPEGLAASATRVVVAVERHDERGSLVASEVYSGPPSGPLRLAWRRPAWSTVLADVSGDRALVVQTPAATDGVRAAIFDAAGRTPVPWASGAVLPVAIAGDYAAVVARRPQRIGLANAATGAISASHRPRARDRRSVDVAADGRLVTEGGRGLLTMSPGAAPRRVPNTDGLERPLFAGSAIAAVAGQLMNHRVVLVGAAGAPRRLGPPTAEVRDVAADEQGVAWLASGCVRYAPIAGSPAPGDICPATEIGLSVIDSSPLRHRTVRVRVRCIATPTGTCSGTLLLKHGKRVVTRAPFTVPAGVLARVPVRLSARGLRVARRERSFILDADVPGGRVWPGNDNSELTVTR